MTVTTTNARHVLFRLVGPARLPDALLGTLRDEIVVTGWMRASGILHDVVLRAIGGTTVRALTGAVQVISLEGSVGLAQGDVTCGLRAVLARETDSGLETLAGEIVEARIDALEVLVTAFDDVTATRQPGVAGVWQIEGSTARAAAQPSPARPPPAPAAPPPPPAPSEPEPARAPAAAVPKPSPTFSAPAPVPGAATGAGAAMPRPIPKPKQEEDEQIYPDAGDVVEHFAFGRCEVIKSDGDRLHLRLGKDGRIKEIALEMLKVTPLPPIDGGGEGKNRHFKLDRKL